MNSIWKILFEGEEQNELFDSEEDALEYAGYLRSCAQLGAEILNMNNPGDNEYDEDNWEQPNVKIIEVEEDN